MIRRRPLRIFDRAAKAAALLLISIVLTGCAIAPKVQLPPVTQETTGEVHPGKFVWVDLLTEDVQKARSFYNEVFGWNIIPSKEDPLYFLIYQKIKPIGGMVAHEDRNKQAQESRWLITLSVEDVDKAAAFVKDKGGKVLDGPIDAEGRGRMALVTDPAGAPLILLRSSGGDPADVPAEDGEWLWNDLFTQNAQPAGDFYTELAGYDAEHIVTDKVYRYYVLKKGEQFRAGIVEIKMEGLKDNWVPYVKVPDIDRTVKKARMSGAELIYQGTDAALLRDPTGAVFGIQTL